MILSAFTITSPKAQRDRVITFNEDLINPGFTRFGLDERIGFGQ
ncbi:hypothetical protein [Heliomarina baculiformis]|nr:hypothetical protein [Heliomarina baculiformis]